MYNSLYSNLKARMVSKMFELEENFGDRLREERIRLSYTQEKLAEQTGVRPLSISQYENGKSSPTTKFLYSLEKLNFDLYYIILAVRKECVPKEYSPELCKKVAKEIDLLELKIGEHLDSEARTRTTAYLLNYFESTPENEGEKNISVGHWLSKVLSLGVK